MANYRIDVLLKKFSEKSMTSYANASGIRTRCDHYRCSGHVISNKRRFITAFCLTKLRSRKAQRGLKSDWTDFVKN